MKKSTAIILNALPILTMMGLIILVKNDYVLSFLYVVIISALFTVKREKGELDIFFFGCFVMILSESVFISTGVETFVRNSLFGLMPLWLPLLWGYSFVAMKRAIKILRL